MLAITTPVLLIKWKEIVTKEKFTLNDIFQPYDDGNFVQKFRHQVGLNAMN